MGDTQKENDKKKVNGHVKAILFERVVFVWEMASLDHGGKLLLDYLKNCRALLANGNVVSMWDDEAVSYMNLLWEVMKKHTVLHHLIGIEMLQYIPGDAGQVDE